MWCEKSLYKQYRCDRCGINFSNKKNYNNHNKKCISKYDKLILGKDYVICSICGYYSKSLAVHILKKHGISSEDYKKDNQIICSKSVEVYKIQNKYNSNWINRAKNQGENLSEYFKKMGDAVKKSILSNPEERSRRAKVMTNVNKSDVMRKKSSETAIKTSARKEIQEQRAEKLKNWRDNNPDIFKEKCTYKMLNSWNSKPETLLYEVIVKRNDYNFRRHQKLKSKTFISITKEKDIDIADKLKKVYIEYDGALHFKNTNLNKLTEIKEKDRLLDEFITKENLTLIRVGYDQFSYRKSDYGFKKECIDKIFEILDNPKPGLYKIGEVYNKK
jgi:predicted transcriptional regulator